jgi:hypothetical protein
VPGLASSAWRALGATVAVLLVAWFFTWALIHDGSSAPFVVWLLLAPIYGLLSVVTYFKFDLINWPAYIYLSLAFAAQFLYFLVIIHAFRVLWTKRSRGHA